MHPRQIEQFANLLSDSAKAKIAELEAENERLRAALSDLRKLLYAEELDTLRRMRTNPILFIEAALAHEQGASTRECSECHRQARQIWLQEHETGCTKGTAALKFDDDDERHGP